MAMLSAYCAFDQTEVSFVISELWLVLVRSSITVSVGVCVRIKVRLGMPVLDDWYE